MPETKYCTLLDKTWNKPLTWDLINLTILSVNLLFIKMFYIEKLLFLHGMKCTMDVNAWCMWRWNEYVNTCILCKVQERNQRKKVSTHQKSLTLHLLLLLFYVKTTCTFYFLKRYICFGFLCCQILMLTKEKIFLENI